MVTKPVTYVQFNEQQEAISKLQQRLTNIVNTNYNLKLSTDESTRLRGYRELAYIRYRLEMLLDKEEFNQGNDHDPDCQCNECYYGSDTVKRIFHPSEY